MNLAQFLCRFQSAMASIDAGQYSLSSDEKPVDFECSPCKDDGLLREAKYYCPECSEYFCSSCEASSHRRLKATKSHKLFPASETTKTVKQKPTKLQIMTCVCDRDTLVEFICDEHRCLICPECKIINHRKCKTDAILQKSQSFNGEVVKALLKRAKSLEDLANELCAEHNKNLETFEARKAECRDEIIQIRDQLVNFIEKLANSALDDLDATSESPSTDLSACRTVIEKLKQDQKLLHDVEESGECHSMFITDFLLNEKFKNYNRLLNEVKRGQTIPSIDFKANPGLFEIQRNFKKIGDIMIKHQLNEMKNFPMSLLHLNAKKNAGFDITPSGVKRMTGSTFLPNGDLVVCDYNSEAVIVLGPEFKEKSRLSMPGHVWGAAVLREKDIVVSLTQLKKLHIVEVDPMLKLKSSIEIGRQCYDVKIIDSKIFVVCTDSPGNGEIRVLGMDGSVIQQLGLNEHIFNYPINLAYNHLKDKIYVSDLLNKQMTCMTVDGNVLFNFRSSVVENTRGILVDEDGNFLLCGYNDIYIVGADGKSYTKFLSNEEGLNADPYALCYRKSDNSLVVTHQTSLLVFKLTTSETDL